MKFKTLFLSLILASSFLLSFNSYALSVLEDGCNPDDDIFCVDDRVEVPSMKEAYKDLEIKDYKNAFDKLLKIANNGGSPDYLYAELWLGRLYHWGLGVGQDDIQAIHWYTQAAKNLVDAQYELGGIYKNGFEEDYKKAVYWHTKAAEQNEHKSQDVLALMYYNGEGVEQDDGQAIYWARRADWSGSDMKTIYDIEVAMQEQGKDYKSAFIKLLKLAEEGFVDKRIAAKFNLGLRYEVGLGVLEDEKEAVKWYRKVLDEESKALNKEKFHSMSFPDINSKWYKNARTNLKWLTSKMAAKNKPNSKPKNKPKRKSKSKPGEQQPSSTGTGFVVTKDGVIATAEHVVDSCNKIEVDNLEASIVVADKKNDMALIKVNKTYTDIASIKTRAPKLGVPVRVFGYPLSYQLSSIHVNVSSGTVNSLAGFGDDTSRFRYDASSQPGNSGGPIVNNKGRVIGVVSAVMKNDKDSDINRQNVNIGVKSSLLVNLMDSKRIPVIDVEIPDDNIVEHYEKATKYIKCFK